MLIVENLRKEFKNITAVDNLSFVIKPGTIFGLLGPNGAGKTTTIRTVLNILKPTSGSISFRNKPLSVDFYNRIGYLPEERGLYKKSSVNDVILFMARMKGLTSKESLLKSSLWLRKMNIEDLKRRKIEELSKGNQQKVQFITSVIHNPDILVFDEPFTGFDPINQQLIKEHILNFSAEGKIIILSTHQMDTAEKLCNEILLINNGKEVLKGDLFSIRKKSGNNFVKIGFTGDPSFLNNHLSVEHLDCYNGYAEVQLKNDVDTSMFLRDISGKMNITHFSVIESSLNKIFIEAVKESNN
jgi:ABC-2 type transport system ATP-binding protein